MDYYVDSWILLINDEGWIQYLINMMKAGWRIDSYDYTWIRLVK